MRNSVRVWRKAACQCLALPRLPHNPHAHVIVLYCVHALSRTFPLPACVPGVCLVDTPTCRFQSCAALARQRVATLGQRCQGRCSTFGAKSEHPPYTTSVSHSTVRSSPMHVCGCMLWVVWCWRPTFGANSEHLQRRTHPSSRQALRGLWVYALCGACLRNEPYAAMQW